MRNLAIPFNIKILKLEKDHLKSFIPVTEVAIFDSNRDTFHPQGLFSNEIFGAVGSEARMNRFSYIDVKLPLLHPVLYKALTSSRKFYTEIMNGSSYAYFSNEDRDFIKSDPIEGKTGYEFFIQHFKDIKLEDTGTTKRDLVTVLLEKYKDLALNQYILVIPAGYRDVEFEEGRPSYDEVNDVYKKLLSLSNNISPSIVSLDPAMVDKTRFKLQEAFNLLYDTLSERIEGKRKLYLGKWASRRIFNGTRNVITAYVPSGRHLRGESAGYNDCIVGLYQLMKSVLPVSIHHLQNSILKEVFLDPNDPVKLINTDSLELEDVSLDSKYFDYFQSVEGLESFITDYQHESMRHKPILIKGHYLMLTYNNDKEYRLFRDIKELPLERDRKDVHPTTYTEFFYHVLGDVLNRVPAITVRYPISGTESTVPATCYLKTTIKSSKLVLLDEDFKPTSKVANEFPILGEKTLESMSPPQAALAGLAADFDGDTMSLNCVYSEEATKEIKNFLQTRKAYVTPMGEFIKSVNYDTVKYICHNLSE